MKDDVLGVIAMVVMMVVVVITLMFLLCIACFSKVQHRLNNNWVVVESV